MEYKILTNGKHYIVKRKKLFRWAGLDVCDDWNYDYSKKRPKLFSSKKEIFDFLKESIWI